MGVLYKNKACSVHLMRLQTLITSHKYTGSDSGFQSARINKENVCFFFTIELLRKVLTLNLLKLAR